jgi:hypothetical protein
MKTMKEESLPGTGEDSQLEIVIGRTGLINPTVQLFRES